MHNIHRIKYKTDNCYIVESNGNAILVDTGSGEAYNTVLEECRKYNLRLIVLTHVHFDHAENAAKLSRELNVPVAFHKADEELFDNYMAQPLMSYGMTGRVVLGTSIKLLRNTKVEKPENIVYIDEGDDLSAYGIDAKIISLPGHTKGSLGVDVEEESLLVGDALDNWIRPATGHLYSDFEDIKNSAGKIKSLGKRTLYYGHGKPTPNRFKCKKRVRRPFEILKKKTAPAREFLKKGRPAGMILEILVGAQFWASTIQETMLYKIPFILGLLIAFALWALAAELLNLVLKLVFGTGKRSKTYFIAAWTAVCGMNAGATQANAMGGALIMSFLLVLSADVLGRVILGFIRTKRFKQIAAYVAATLCTAYLVLFAVFYRVDKFGKSRVDFYNAIEGEQTSVVDGFSSYLKDGPYTVSSLSYGPDETDDIITGSIDLTVFGSTKEAGDPITSLTWLASDRDYAKTPIKGRIWYPEGRLGCPVFFIVHGNHESTTPSYLGYEYLGQYLASNGYAVISVDENIINELGAGNDLRAYVLLENMKTLLDLSKQEDGRISGLLDPDRIAVGGHSRGGEMVATAYLFNDLDAYPENGNIRFDYHFNITSVVAIAPVCDQYTPVGRAVEISDVNYLLIHGSNDQDVSDMMGEKQYNNITFTGKTDEKFIKASLYILGANHGQFNSEWGRYDMAPMGKGYLNTYNFIDEADQKLIAKAYIRTFLDNTILKDDTYASLFKDISLYEGDLPDTVYVTNYEDSARITLCSFDDTVDIVNAGNGTSLSVTGAGSWTYVPYSRGFGGESEEYVLSVKWEDESEPSVSVAFKNIDISKGAIGFGIADMREDTEDMEEGLDYTVVLTDSSGRTASLKTPVLVYHSFAVQLYKQDVFFGSYEYKHQIQTVMITPDMFEGSGLDLSAVTGITISTDGTAAGEIIIDDIGYYTY